MNSGTIENVTFNGGSNQILPGNGTVTVKGCTFNDSTGHAIYTESTSGTLHIDGCTFNENASGYAVIMRTADSTSTNSTYNAKLNLLADGVAANVTGNVFNDRVKLYTSDETLSGNAFGTDGYIAVDSDEPTDIDVSRNYWGGGEPSSEQIPSNVTCISYYTTYENNAPGNLVIMEEYIVAYVGSEPFINLMDAINNANGKPVVLAKDITPADDDTTGSIPVIVIPANTTIDANRHTVTAEVYVSGNGEASVKNIGNNKLGFTLTTPASHANVYESEIFIHPGYNNARKYSNPVIYYIDGEPYTAFIEQDRIDVLLPMQADHCEDIALVTPEPNIDIDKVDYEIFEGAKTIFQYGLLHIYDVTSAQYHSETWRKDSKVDLLFKGNGFFSGVSGMKITEKDTGKTYATDPHKISKYVSLDFGCTALTLEHEYLQTMPNGEYVITINYADGGAHTSNLKIIKAASSSKADPTNPKTGDFILMPMAIMTLSAAALAVLLISKKKHA